MRVAAIAWRPPVLALAAAIILLADARANDVTLEERLQLCGTCHGADGNSRMEKIPSLAGQPELMLVNQLIFMREGVRPIEAMAPFVKDLKDGEIEALAKHYANAMPQRSDESIDPALVARGAALAAQRRCAACHGTDLAGRDQIPRIAKQRVDYLIVSLTRFRDRPHPSADTIMSGSVAGLPNADLAALAHYAASR
jgi:cytochrome c553